MNFPLQTAVLRASAPAIQADLLRATKQQIERAEADFGSNYRRGDAALLVVGRGASEAAVNAVITKLARLLWEGLGFAWAVACYSDAAAPDLGAALAQVERLGFRRAVVCRGGPLDPDRLTAIRAAVAAYRRAHPDTIIVEAGSLDGDAAVAATDAPSNHTLDSGADNDNCLTCRYRPRAGAVRLADDSNPPHA